MAPPAAPIAALHARLRRRAPLRSYATQARLRRPHDAPPECKGRYLAWVLGAAPGSGRQAVSPGPNPQSPRDKPRAQVPRSSACYAPPPSAKYAAQHSPKACIGRIPGKNTPQLTKHPRPMQRSPSAAQPSLAICRKPASGSSVCVRYIAGLIACRLSA